MPNILVNGLELNYVVDGPEGAPWITFITGITNDTTMWDDNISALSRDFHLLRLDTRGHGASETARGPYSFDQLTGDVAGVLNKLGIDNTHVVGIGLGGMTSIAFALRFPQIVSSIVPTACRAELVCEYEAIWPPMVEMSAQGGIEAIVDITADRWFPENFRTSNPEQMSKVKTMIKRTSLNGYHGCIQALLTVGFGARLSELNMPALFISGDEDLLGGPATVMQKMAQAVPNGGHISLPDAGHICNIANPAAFNLSLLKFFKDLNSKKRSGSLTK